MKKLITTCAVVAMILVVSGVARADADLFNDEDRATLQVRSDSEDDYGRRSVKAWSSSQGKNKLWRYIYPEMWGFPAGGSQTPYTWESYGGEDEGNPGYCADITDGDGGPALPYFTHTYDGCWSTVSLPFAGTNADGSAFDVQRDVMESMRFYLVSRASRYNEDDEINFQIDNIKLTRDGGGELVIDNFDDGALRWSYQVQPDESAQNVTCTLADVSGRGKVLDVQVTDLLDPPVCESPDWDMDFIDIFTCLTDDATDSFIYGDDWSAYDNLTFDWLPIDQGTRQGWFDLHVRTDVVPEPAAMSLLALGGLALLRRRRFGRAHRMRK